MVIKIPANLIFKVKTKKNVFNEFFHFMSMNIDLGKKYFLQKLEQMKRSIFNVRHTFALEPLFLEKNEIKWNQTDRHTMGSFSKFKSSPIKVVFIHENYTSGKNR